MGPGQSKVCRMKWAPPISKPQWHPTASPGPQPTHLVACGGHNVSACCVVIGVDAAKQLGVVDQQLCAPEPRAIQHDIAAFELCSEGTVQDDARLVLQQLTKGVPGSILMPCIPSSLRSAGLLDGGHAFIVCDADGLWAGSPWGLC